MSSLGESFVSLAFVEWELLLLLLESPPGELAVDTYLV